jgi:hypothetical protein
MFFEFRVAHMQDQILSNLPADLMLQRVNDSRGRLWNIIHLFRLYERVRHEITTQKVECSAVYLITGVEFSWPV